MCRKHTFFIVERMGLHERKRGVTVSSLYPLSLRALFGVSALANAVHGSSSTDQAHDEIETIFGKVEFNPNGNVKDEGEGSSHDVVQEGETTGMPLRTGCFHWLFTKNKVPTK